jgi:hypothetical protein
MRSKPNLVSLCGIADDATEADLSGLGMDADDAAILASELPDKRALLLLNLASNNLGGLSDWMEPPREDLKLGDLVDGNPVVDIYSDGDIKIQDASGLIAIANAIPDMGAMTSLNLASNRLGAEGAKIVAEAIKVAKCTPAIILVPFSCPSDFSINCCCLLLSAGYAGTIVCKSSQE